MTNGHGIWINFFFLYSFMHLTLRAANAWFSDLLSTSSERRLKVDMKFRFSLPASFQCWLPIQHSIHRVNTYLTFTKHQELALARAYKYGSF
jgi:hypothetical protein